MDKATRDNYQAVIGLEVHIQLLTRSKLFAPDSNNYGDAPNTNISVITLAHPGTLPKLNKNALELAIKMGLACGSKISQHLNFDRKNYFYPDLPKGFQLTQDRTPICVGGSIPVTTQEGTKELKLNRIHLEEDAGKSFHPPESGFSLIDFNRAGTPLIELVTEPVLHQPEEAYQLLYEIRKLVTHLGICDGNMEEGSLRCDANVSVRAQGSTELGTKVEIKNMNSLRNVRKAITHEIDRQIVILEQGQVVRSETRTFDETTGGSASMRIKEELNDYRYFPEPDLSPVHISDEWLQAIKDSMPPLPNELRARLMKDHEFSLEDATFLSETSEMYAYFQEALASTPEATAILNWLKGPIQSYLKDRSLVISQLSLTPGSLGELATLVEGGALSFSLAAQKLIPILLEDAGQTARQLADTMGLLQIQDKNSLENAVVKVLEEFPAKVAAYKEGKKGLIGFFMGQLMQKTEGKIDPRMANELLSKHLN